MSNVHEIENSDGMISIQVDDQGWNRDVISRITDDDIVTMWTFWRNQWRFITKADLDGGSIGYVATYNDETQPGGGLVEIWFVDGDAFDVTELRKCIKQLKRHMLITDTEYTDIMATFCRLFRPLRDPVSHPGAPNSTGIWRIPMAYPPIYTDDPTELFHQIACRHGCRNYKLLPSIQEAHAINLE